ncbi:MAG: ribonuclease Z [Melioribacteraceae bacterium]|nr:ribonuclease Z [Melioribacteraceae bacterium]
MEIKFIGTGSGITSLKRFHSSILINNYTLIDCGDSTTRALLSGSTGINAIGNIVITHFHPDHYSGLTSLIVNMYLTGRSEKLIIYVHQNMIPFTIQLFKHSYLLSIQSKLGIEIKGYDAGEEIILSDDLKIIPYRNSHIINNNDLEDSDIYYSFSLLLKTAEKSVAYTSDIGCPEDLLLFKEIPLDLLISEATHVNIDGILSEVAKFSTGNIILTHIDENSEDELDKKLAALDSELNIIKAFDGLVIRI